MYSSRQCRDFATRFTLCALLLLVVRAANATEVDGFTEPYRDVDISASEMGVLESVDVEEGGRVVAGQTLARLEGAVLQASLEIAKRLMESTGRLESAEAELELQREVVAKLRDLRSRGHASLQEIERAQSQLRILEAHLKAAQEECEVRQLEFERTRIQLEQRQLTSPIDGVVTRIFKDRGEFVTMSDPVVLKVVQLDPLLVVFSVPSERARELAVGRKVNLNIAESPLPTQGEIEFVSPTADPQSGTTRVRVRIPNPKEQLPSGATCRLILRDPAPVGGVAGN